MSTLFQKERRGNAPADAEEHVQSEPGVKSDRHYEDERNSGNGVDFLIAKGVQCTDVVRSLPHGIESMYSKTRLPFYDGVTKGTD